MSQSGFDSRAGLIGMLIRFVIGLLHCGSFLWLSGAYKFNC